MPSAQTNPLTVRLCKDQLEALKHLPSHITSSILLRVLLGEYLAGRLPYIQKLVLEEAARTDAAVKNGQRILQLKNAQRKATKKP